VYRFASQAGALKAYDEDYIFSVAASRGTETRNECVQKPRNTQETCNNTEVRCLVAHLAARGEFFFFGPSQADAWPAAGQLR